jgi:uncharacterized protein (TIGR03437 family)
LHAQTPVVLDNGTVNGASFAASQPVTPGSLVSIFGSQLAGSLESADSIPLSTARGDVSSVTFNGIVAPLYFVSPGQINAQLPWNVLPNGAASGSVNVVVTRNGVKSAPKSLQVGAFSPGIFATTPNPDGTLYAIAVNLDGTLAQAPGAIAGLTTHPAKAGDTIIVYANGLGPVDKPVDNGNNTADGLRTNTTFPTAMVGGVVASVPFSGLAPQFVGVNQVNIVIPQGVTPGNAVTLQLQTGGITSTDKVIIAVQ